jgi:hypothetical protein
MWNKSEVPDDDESEVLDDVTVDPVIIAEEPVIEVVETDSIEEIAPLEEIAPVIEPVEEIVQEVVLEKPVVEDRFVIKVGENQWLKSWFSLCDKKDDAIVLNSDWARGHHNRVTHIKKLRAEIVKL